MAGFFSDVFGGGSAASYCFVGHWCVTHIKFSNKIETPGGSRVSKVRVCVDIWYSVRADEIVVDRVQLSQGGSSLGGKSINIATMRGEVFFATSICDSQFLKLAVENELENKNIGLHKRMLAKWRGANRSTFAQLLIDALNEQASPDEIEDLIFAGGRGKEIVFTYTKPNGDYGTRHAAVDGISGDSIRAFDHMDGKVKNFRIDRITNVRKP